jgi:hypothetical protein
VSFLPGGRAIGAQPRVPRYPPASTTTATQRAKRHVVTISSAVTPGAATGDSFRAAGDVGRLGAGGVGVLAVGDAPSFGSGAAAGADRTGEGVALGTGGGWVVGSDGAGIVGSDGAPD